MEKKKLTLLQIAHMNGGVHRFAKMCGITDRKEYQHFRKVANGKSMMYASELLMISDASGIPLDAIVCENSRLEKVRA